MRERDEGRRGGGEVGAEREEPRASASSYNRVIMLMKRRILITVNVYLPLDRPSCATTVPGATSGARVP